MKNRKVAKYSGQKLKNTPMINKKKIDEYIILLIKSLWKLTLFHFIKLRKLVLINVLGGEK